MKKLGTALVLMHEYDKATQHYEDAIKLLHDHDLRFEYLDLLIKVRNILTIILTMLCKMR